MKKNKSEQQQKFNSFNQTNRYSLATISDPLLLDQSQWHLGFIGSKGYQLKPSSKAKEGIEAIWSSYQGDDVTIGIWDDGVQQTHWDLSSNYNSKKDVTVKGLLNDGQPLSTSAAHGTSVAGLISANDNSQGGVGVAHDARITGIRIFGGADDINAKWDRYLLTLDSLKNFDVTNHSYGAFPNFTLFSDVAKFKVSAELGRAGLGTINVKSAGNSNVNGNGDALDSSRFTVTVAAIGKDGYVTSYSTYGAHILVSAPAASVTTDLLGTKAGYNGLLKGDYTNQFGGTSASGPVTAGVIALMIDANPALGWRDILNILAFSATGIGSLYGQIKPNENFAWKWNGANNWNGGGLHFSEDYGYGMVNAFNAVRMAEVWNLFIPNAGTSLTEKNVSTGLITINQNIEDQIINNYEITITKNIYIEHVTLYLSFKHSNFTDLNIRLISPKGTIFSLLNRSIGNEASSDNLFQYTFGAEGYRGEESQGKWILEIEDSKEKDAGKLNHIELIAYGSEVTNNNIYHFTNEIFNVYNQNQLNTKFILNDTNNGVDWLQAASLTFPLELYLSEGKNSLIDGQTLLYISPGSIIENAIGGESNDKIEGNNSDNIVYGMRGDDILSGGEGFDIAGFIGFAANYVISTVDGKTIVRGAEGVDSLVGFEILRFFDKDIVDPSLLPPIVDTSPPLLQSMNPSDNSNAVSITSNIVLSFNENVKIGEGYIQLFASNGLLIEKFDKNKLSVFNDTITINPSINLNTDSSYYILIDGNTVLDIAGNSLNPIIDKTFLNFDTVSSFNMINGTSSADRLIGTILNDLIKGFEGNDTINGRQGMDNLYGGVGQDFFVFDTQLISNNVDKIIDFNATDDTIRLENAIFSRLLKTGTLNSNFFRLNNGGIAHDNNDYLLFDTSTGNLFYDSDGNGVGKSVLFATLIELVGTLSSNDFIVI